MSEKERQITKEEEEVILDHFLHEHPLSLTETRVESICDCCRRRFYGELGYSCSKKCGSDVVLHEECAEMPRNITHPTHPPQHTLTQMKHMWPPGNCTVCELDMTEEVGYRCSSSGCEFHLHLRCASSMGVVYAAGDHSMTHPSHPQHELRSWRRPGRSCLFRCDACGTRQLGSSYACFACQYWIHESCAALAVTAWFPHHQHSLSLDFHFPIEYVVFNFKCDLCRKPLLRKHWVYHCRLCRYIVHIKCAITATSSPNTLDNEAHAAEAEDEDVIQFPINDIAEELIRSFVRRAGAAHDDDEIINGLYKFHSHDHQLSLVSSSSHDDQEEEEEDSDDDDDDLNYGQTSELACDGCTAPIYHQKKKSSSSSPSHSNYYSCVEGKYFLHSACFSLPLEFTPSHPLHHQHKTPLKLQTCPKLESIICSICKFYTNGLYYSCAECDFKADIKCASLPATIKHEAHPQRHHHLKLVDSKDYKDSLHVRCIGCSDFLVRPGAIFYTCQKCEFILCCACVLLPRSDDTRYLDQHALPLAFDAAVDHPEKFYCDECEQEINPKCWMYHCRRCDTSLHPRCIATLSGYCRNIKFGHEFAIDALHAHPLRLERLIRKLRCDVCGDKEENFAGFRCASCNFFACGCDQWSNDDVLPID